MVLITSRQSNIIQDIATLHLFARCVGEECAMIDEKEVTRNAFELLFAFDEIVTVGYSEPVTLSGIHTILEMESHEEKMQEMLAKVLCSPISVASATFDSRFVNPTKRQRSRRQRKSPN